MMKLPEQVAALITDPAVPAWIVQREGKRFQIAWRDQAHMVAIYEVVQPYGEQRQASLATVQGGNDVWVEGTAVRPYFALDFRGGRRDGQRLIVAERRLPLQGVPNFRDIGGYVGKNGRLTRWGAVYRSGGLHEAKTADLTYLSTLDLQNIFDLRTSSEIAARPDQLPPSAPTWIHAGLKSHQPRWRQLIDVIRYRHRLQALLIKGYIDIFLEQNADLVGLLLTQFADEASFPILLHCTAGKDRTGLLIALLLSMLGVSEDVILADYTLSNHDYFTFHRVLQDDVARLVRFGFAAERIEPLFLADPYVLKTVLEHIKIAYGSIEQYFLTKAGVHPSALDKIRDILLVNCQQA